MLPAQRGVGGPSDHRAGFLLGGAVEAPGRSRPAPGVVDIRWDYPAPPSIQHTISAGAIPTLSLGH
jgi:hypothetical protein